MFLTYLAVIQSNVFGEVLQSLAPVIALVAGQRTGHFGLAVLGQLLDEVPGDVVPRRGGHVTDRACFAQGKPLLLLHGFLSLCHDQVLVHEKFIQLGVTQSKMFYKIFHLLTGVIA